MYILTFTIQVYKLSNFGPMCGIVGQYFFNTSDINTDSVQKALTQLTHRGPDNQSHKEVDHCVLGHTRLSIIDLNASANQPMTDVSGRYTLTFNGEIYNYLDLKAELLESGVTFKTQSDTEVLLYHLIKNGVDGLNALNGFFAFAFYDQLENVLVLARDRFGIKPLYWFKDTTSFGFASELKPLLNLGVSKTIDQSALINFFRFNYIPAPQTILQAVKKLEPGSYLMLKNEKVRIQQYYKNVSKNENHSLYSILEDAVQKRLVADVEVGSFLSGGIDSSIIAALAKQHHTNIRTFSIGFESDSVFDESRYAQQVADHIKSDHQTIYIQPKTLKTAALEMGSMLDEPFADSSSIAVYCLSKSVRQQVKVALSGDGADELFAGYNKHLALLKALETKGITKSFYQFLAQIPFQGSRNSRSGNLFRKIRKFGNGLSKSPYDRYILWSSFCSETRIAALLNSEISEYTDLEELWHGNFEDYLQMDQKLVLPNDMLKKVDAMSMMNGLEVRVPFLDHRVVEYARTLKSNDLIANGHGKQILRSAFSELLPKDIFTRPKHGFEVPIARWIRTDLSREIDDMLEPHNINRTGILNADEVQKTLQTSRSRQPGDTPYQVWAIFVLQNWINENL